jgi:hypothetical protein
MRVRTPSSRTKLPAIPVPASRSISTISVGSIPSVSACARPSAGVCEGVASEEVLDDVFVEPRHAVDALVVVQMVDLLVRGLRAQGDLLVRGLGAQGYLLAVGLRRRDRTRGRARYRPPRVPAVCCEPEATREPG